MNGYRIALAGNPNAGKTTLFNALTGMRQHTGNWPGKTVERKDGSFSHAGIQFNVIDLPGTYSLTAYTIEEVVARNFIIQDRPDIVVNIADAGNLERNLYLTVQLIEMGVNVVLALNMNRIAEVRGVRVDEVRLSKLLGIPVVKIEANTGEGVDELVGVAVSALESDRMPKNKLKYGPEIEEHAGQLELVIKVTLHPKHHVNAKWLALKLLENDPLVIEKTRLTAGGLEVLESAAKIRSHLYEVFGKNVDSSIADARYGFIAGLLGEAVERPKIDQKTVTEVIDRVALDGRAGVPLFFVMMFFMFWATFTLSGPIVTVVEGLFEYMASYSSVAIVDSGGPEWAASLVADAVIGGVGSVLSFVPIIFVLFFVMSLIEDSGYMARAAFIMDRLMHKIGLHGKAFIPLVLGFGCTVPAVMATRTLESRKDRIKTMLIAPLMSCGARLPVYMLFAAAFFERHQSLVVFAIYVFGIMLALFMGLVFNRTVFHGKSSPFVMELPPYRVPTLKGAFIHMWERGKMFVIKAGTIILGASVLVWFLASFPFGVEYASPDSLMGVIGSLIAPVLEPLGFGTWQAAVSLIFGVFAKEIIVSTLGALGGAGDIGVVAALRSMFTPLSAFSFMVFVLIYSPCVATIAMIKKETGSWKWAAFTIAYLTALAWVVSFMVYQGGLLLGL